MKGKALELNRINNEAEKALNKENQMYMTDVICYLRMKNASDYDVEIIRRDIINMMADAEGRGETAEVVFGSDYKKFCDEMLESVDRKDKKEVFFEHVDMVLGAGMILAAISFIRSGIVNKVTDYLFHRGTVDWYWNITGGDVMTWGVLLAGVFIMFRWIANTPISGENGKHSKGKCFLVSAGVMAVMLLLAYLTKAHFYDSIVKVHLLIAMFGFAVAYLLHWILKKNY